jgi:hypothetical protein
MRTLLVCLLVATGAVLALALTAWAAELVLPMQPGDSVVVTCPNQMTGTIVESQASLACAPNPTATSTATETPLPPTRTATTTATSTATATLTSTATVPATATVAVPTPTAGAVAGQPCPAALHDAIVTAGPDGLPYPTWHPAVDPGSGCLFGHEHGSDPRSSAVNATLPAFGAVGAVAGVAEPHAGFKVFVWHYGEPTDLGPVTADSRAVFHQGTSGVGRYTTRFHSLVYDYVARDGSGREAHVAGMADTNVPLGSTCTNPRAGGRDFSTVGCPDPYEIWNNVHLQIIHPGDPYTDYLHTRLTISGSFAVFDPITTRDPADNSRLLYSLNYYQPNSTTDPTSASAPYRGCDREAYGGPNYWGNAGRPTVYYTDAYGVVVPGATALGPGLIRQSVAAVSSGNNQSFKVRRQHCTGGVHSPN